MGESSSTRLVDSILLLLQYVFHRFFLGSRKHRHPAANNPEAAPFGAFHTPRTAFLLIAAFPVDLLSQKPLDEQRNARSLRALYMDTLSHNIRRLERSMCGVDAEFHVATTVTVAKIVACRSQTLPQCHKNSGLIRQNSGLTRPNSGLPHKNETDNGNEKHGVVNH